MGRGRTAGHLRPPVDLFRQPHLRDPEQCGQGHDAREAGRRARSDELDLRSTRCSGRLRATSRPTSPVTDSGEYKAMEPNATYSPLTANMIYDPEIAARRCRRADLRRHVDLFRPDPERRDGPGRGRRGDQSTNSTTCSSDRCGRAGDRPAACGCAEAPGLIRNSRREALVAFVLIAPFVAIYGLDLRLSDDQTCSFCRSRMRR